MRRRLYYTLTLILLSCLWQYLGMQYSRVRLLASYPTLSLSYFVDNCWNLIAATRTTLAEAALGLAIAAAVAFLLNVLCMYRPAILAYLTPIMVASQVVPLVVVAPFIVLLLGAGISSKVALATLIAFFPIFINLSSGFLSIDRDVVDLLNIYEARTFFRIWRVYIPLSMPALFAGLKIGSTLAVIGAIVAEFTGAERGLGKNLLLTTVRIEPELMINSLLLSALCGGLLYGLIALVERKFGRWYLVGT